MAQLYLLSRADSLRIQHAVPHQEKDAVMAPIALGKRIDPCLSCAVHQLRGEGLVIAGLETVIRPGMLEPMGWDQSLEVPLPDS